jgi:hypothetical protein
VSGIHLAAALMVLTDILLFFAFGLPTRVVPFFLGALLSMFFLGRTFGERHAFGLARSIQAVRDKIAADRDSRGQS